MQPTDVDRAVWQAIYDHFIRQPTPPTLHDIATRLALPPQAVAASYARLAARQRLVLDPVTHALWMAIPFSAVPTDVQVQQGAQRWWANCAWDALGIAAMIDAPLQITTVCPDCGEPIILAFPACLADAAAPVLHFAVPPARWWDDIGAT